MDNASIHVTNLIKNAVKEAEIEVICNVPYNPKNNLIELFFQDIKLEFYRNIFNNK